MSHLFILSIFAALIIPASSFPQKKWDGGAGNNLWSNANNWTGNSLPTSSDNIVLDNSLVSGNYTVALPSTATTVKTITISPAAGRTIELTLPSTNTAIPGLTVSGPGYGLTINSGGTFRNSSGSSSGNTVVVTDSIRINNDGRYVHNSASGHSSNVQVLSRAAGTEKGILELDIPTASSTISISGRTFGKFVLRSTAAGGACNYTAAGTSRVVIRDGLDIGAGVNFNLNCSDTIFVGGDFTQESGILNLGNSTRSVVLSLQQNINQNTSAVITETGTGTQTLLINGTGFQLVLFKGTIANQVGIVKDAAGVAWFKSAVSLPYKLTLKYGRILTTQALITLQSSCAVIADTLSNNTCIEGPLKKEGLNNQAFLFPVGESGVMRWLQLLNATGNFTVEYFKNDPHTVSGSAGAGIDHFSKVEYWDVTSTAGSSAKIKLSFAHPQSGGVTNLSGLRVARLINGTWEDVGNAGVAGTPGSDGWVSSNAASGFSASSKSFALASAMGQENPLPLSSIQLNATRNGGRIFFTWEIQPELNIDRLELQRSYDGQKYVTVYYHPADDETKFSYSQPQSTQTAYYRIVALSDVNIKKYISNIKEIKAEHAKTVIVGSNRVNNILMLAIYSEKPKTIVLKIFDVTGRMVKSYAQKITEGTKWVQLNVTDLRPGNYFISEVSGSNIISTLRFVKI
jgi:hypothetical protein